MMKSNRKVDSQQESIVNSFALKYFLNKEYGLSYLVDDVNLQVLGVDAVCDGKYFDLKAQSSRRYLNNPTDTFAFEISFLNSKGHLMKGWYMDDHLKTQYYALIWIPRAKVNADGWLENSDSIEKMEIMVVDREKLHNYTKTLVDDKSLYDTSNAMRYSNAYGHKINLTNEVRLSHTSNLFEKPSNLVIKKSLLKNFATKHCLVTKDKIINL